MKFSSLTPREQAALQAFRKSDAFYPYAPDGEVGASTLAAIRAVIASADGEAADGIDDERANRNAAFMIAAVNALPELLDRVEKLEAALLECADGLEESNTYVTTYFVEKHDLDAPIGRARALLAPPVETREAGKP